MSQKTDIKIIQESPRNTMEKQQRTLSEEKATEFYNEISEFFKDKGFKLNDQPNVLKLRTQKLNYTCACGNIFSREFKEIKRNRECRKCKSLAVSDIPKDFSNCPEALEGEKWVAIKGGFISSKGRCASAIGSLLTMDERQRYYIGGTHQYAKILMAQGFKIEGSENLNGQKSNAVVRNTDAEQINLENIQITTRNQVGKENGSKARQSEEFKEKQSMNIADHSEKFKYIRSQEFPEYWIFEDGNIYNTNDGQGGKRFLVGSKSQMNKEKIYLRIHRNNEHIYIHRLVCMTYYPIDGKKSYKDYEDMQVNHKNGNTLDNHKDNLEWMTQSQNIAHAYSEGLNKKVRNIIQYEKNQDGTQGKMLAEFVSIAEASRQTKVPEHQIRISAQGKQCTSFIFKFKDESKTAEFSLKYSRGPKKVTKHDPE